MPMIQVPYRVPVYVTVDTDTGKVVKVGVACELVRRDSEDDCHAITDDNAYAIADADPRARRAIEITEGGAEDWPAWELI